MHNTDIFEGPIVEEPILKSNEQRFVLFPIKYHSVY